MFELDFAFLNMKNQDRTGLAFRKVFLDRLAPLFFGPRVQTLVDFEPLGFKGCSVLLPLGPANWNILTPDLQENILQQSQPILNDYCVSGLGIDRLLKKQLLQLSTSFPLIFGDNFIKALAFAMIRYYLSCRAFKRLVVVGEMPDMQEFVQSLKQFDIPVSIQNYFPGSYEVMAYHMLYEKGIAISTSYLNPRDWEPGDLVIMVESVYSKYIPLATQPVLVNLTDESRGLAPRLERCLEQRGLAPGMNVMAPVLESCLLNQAGSTSASGEETENIPLWEQMEHLGDHAGMWDYFLDKAE
jgi:hypothetical protein